MNKNRIPLEYQDLPRDERLKIKHQIADTALSAVISAGGRLRRAALVENILQNSQHSEDVVQFGLQSGISRGLLRYNNDDTLESALDSYSTRQ